MRTRRESPTGFKCQILSTRERGPLRGFLDFWEDNLDGRLHSVAVASCRLVRPAEYRHLGACLTLH